MNITFWLAGLPVPACGGGDLLLRGGGHRLHVEGRRAVGQRVRVQRLLQARQGDLNNAGWRKLSRSWEHFVIFSVLKIFLTTENHPKMRRLQERLMEMIILISLLMTV